MSRLMVLLAAFCLIPPLGVRAQPVTGGSWRPSGPVPTDAVVPATVPTWQAPGLTVGGVWDGPESAGMQSGRRKSPVVAGALSFLIPFGTGSFYAENMGHGLIHLSAGGAMVGLFLANLCLESCTSGEETGMVVAMVGFTANWLVGTLTAVLDADSFNDKHARGAVTVTPVVAFQALPTPGGLPAHAVPSAGVRVTIAAF